MQIDESASLTYKRKLSENSLRQTHVRKSIFEVLYFSKTPLSIQSLVDQIDSAHFVSIYRSVDLLHKAGVLKMVPQGFKNHFELSDLFKPHHHHITCKECNKSIEVHDQRIEKLMNQLTTEAGLIPTEHHFEIYGICRKCDSTS